MTDAWWNAPEQTAQRFGFSTARRDSTIETGASEDVQDFSHLQDTFRALSKNIDLSIPDEDIQLYEAYAKGDMPPDLIEEYEQLVKSGEISLPVKELKPPLIAKDKVDKYLRGEISPEEKAFIDEGVEAGFIRFPPLTSLDRLKKERSRGVVREPEEIANFEPFYDYDPKEINKGLAELDKEALGGYFDPVKENIETARGALTGLTSKGEDSPTGRFLEGMGFRTVDPEKVEALKLFGDSGLLALSVLEGLGNTVLGGAATAAHKTIGPEAGKFVNTLGSNLFMLGAPAKSVAKNIIPSAVKAAEKVTKTAVEKTAEKVSPIVKGATKKILPLAQKIAKKEGVPTPSSREILSETKPSSLYVPDTKTIKETNLGKVGSKAVGRDEKAILELAKTFDTDPDVLKAASDLGVDVPAIYATKNKDISDLHTQILDTLSSEKRFIKKAEADMVKAIEGSFTNAKQGKSLDTIADKAKETVVKYLKNLEKVEDSAWRNLENKIPQNAPVNARKTKELVLSIIRDISGTTDVEQGLKKLKSGNPELYRFLKNDVIEADNFKRQKHVLTYKKPSESIANFMDEKAKNLSKLTDKEYVPSTLKAQRAKLASHKEKIHLINRKEEFLKKNLEIGNDYKARRTEVKKNLEDLRSKKADISNKIDELQLKAKGEPKSELQKQILELKRKKNMIGKRELSTKDKLTEIDRETDMLRLRQDSANKELFDLKQRKNKLMNESADIEEAIKTKSSLDSFVGKNSEYFKNFDLDTTENLKRLGINRPGLSDRFTNLKEYVGSRLTQNEAALPLTFKRLDSLRKELNQLKYAGGDNPLTRSLSAGARNRFISALREDMIQNARRLGDNIGKDEFDFVMGLTRRSKELQASLQKQYGRLLEKSGTKPIKSIVPKMLEGDSGALKNVMELTPKELRLPAFVGSLEDASRVTKEGMTSFNFGAFADTIDRLKRNKNTYGTLLKYVDKKALDSVIDPIYSLSKAVRNLEMNSKLVGTGTQAMLKNDLLRKSLFGNILSPGTLFSASSSAGWVVGGPVGALVSGSMFNTAMALQSSAAKAKALSKVLKGVSEILHAPEFKTLLNNLGDEKKAHSLVKQIIKNQKQRARRKEF